MMEKTRAHVFIVGALACVIVIVLALWANSHLTPEQLQLFMQYMPGSMKQQTMKIIAAAIIMLLFASAGVMLCEDNPLVCYYDPSP
jgi:F0F1-type ATP synthase membrane subunit a